MASRDVCGFITRSGNPCRAMVVKGGDRCVAHSGATGARVTEAQLLRLIGNAAQDDWRAAAWLMNRLYPVSGKSRSEVAPVVEPDDAFAEVDQLAERRRG